MQVVASNAQARHHTVAVRKALLIAQSQLALALETGVTDSAGREGTLVWRSEISRYPGTENSHGLEQVTVTVTDPVQHREVTRISSLRLVR